MNQKKQLRRSLIAALMLALTIGVNRGLLSITRDPYNVAMGIGMFRIPTATIATAIGGHTVGWIEWQGVWTAFYFSGVPALRIPDRHSLDYGMKIFPAAVVLLLQVCLIGAMIVAFTRWVKSKLPNHASHATSEPAPSADSSAHED